MNNKVIIYIAAIITIAAVASAAFIYIHYSAQANTVQSNNGSISVVDDEGYVTTLTSIPQRIVSLAPSCTQILFAIGDGPKVVGVTTYDNYPYNFTAWAAAGNMTIDGGYGTPNMEVIASLRPDLILTDNINDGPNLASLRASGYKVIVLEPSSVTGIEQDIMLVGRATGAETEATAVAASISSIVSNIQAKIAAANITTTPTVYYEIWNNPLMSVGAGSWISDAIAKAGGVNIFENVSQAYPTVSSETVVALDPSVIILPSGSGGMAFYGSVADVEARPGWNTISAVQNGKIYVINQDLFAEAAPRVGELIQDIAACLYPQLFNSTSSSTS
ncbi:MAG TPA: cobalamin-binding protein [Candidatus Limnocylindrales bacterium]|nr:cobalamin-binding protein [Candidatus Limnocylindrales bacterium]